MTLLATPGRSFDCFGCQRGRHLTGRQVRRHRHEDRLHQEVCMVKVRLVVCTMAMLGMAVGTASAARFMNQPGNPNSPTGTGIVTDATGFQESGSPYTGGQGQGETESQVPFSTFAAPGTASTAPSTGVTPGSPPKAGSTH
jgi:hypothetical protein